MIQNLEKVDQEDNIGYQKIEFDQIFGNSKDKQALKLSWENVNYTIKAK